MACHRWQQPVTAEIGQTMSMEDIRETILTVAMADLAFDGFSHKTLSAATRRAGLDGDLVAMAFPRGPLDLAVHYTNRLDQRLLSALELLDLPAMKIRQRIATALNARLDLIAGEREVYRQLIQFFALPGHLVAASKSLYRTVDVIWLAAGDTATDYNFYTKRLILGGVLSATTLFWLQDDSEGFQQTRDFIDRRINDVMQIEKAKAKAASYLTKLPDLAGSFARWRYRGAR